MLVANLSGSWSLWVPANAALCDVIRTSASEVGHLKHLYIWELFGFLAHLEKKLRLLLYGKAEPPSWLCRALSCPLDWRPKKVNIFKISMAPSIVHYLEISMCFYRYILSGVILSKAESYLFSVGQLVLRKSGSSPFHQLSGVKLLDDQRSQLPCRLHPIRCNHVP